MKIGTSLRQSRVRENTFIDLHRTRQFLTCNLACYVQRTCIAIGASWLENVGVIRCAEGIMARNWADSPLNTVWVCFEELLGEKPARTLLITLLITHVCPEALGQWKSMALSSDDRLQYRSRCVEQADCRPAYFTANFSSVVIYDQSANISRAWPCNVVVGLSA